MIVEKVERKKASTVVVEQIEEMIANGIYKAGDKLPSVRELCEWFDVSRSTVRDAIITLKGKGTVEIRHGEGTFVKGFDASHIFQKPVLQPNKQNIKELFQVRRILEAGVAKEAALYRTDDDLARLEKALTNGKVQWESDYDFHIAIAFAAKNNVITKFMEYISETLKQTMIQFHEHIQSDARIVQLIADQHEYIYEMVKQRDPFKAYEAMVTHLVYVEKLLLDYFSDDEF